MKALRLFRAAIWDCDTILLLLALALIAAGLLTWNPPDTADEVVPIVPTTTSTSTGTTMVSVAGPDGPSL